MVAWFWWYLIMFLTLSWSDNNMSKHDMVVFGYHVIRRERQAHHALNRSWWTNVLISWYRLLHRWRVSLASPQQWWMKSGLSLLILLGATITQWKVTQQNSLRYTRRSAKRMFSWGEVRNSTVTEATCVSVSLFWIEHSLTNRRIKLTGELLRKISSTMYGEVGGSSCVQSTAEILHLDGEMSQLLSHSEK